MGNISAEVLGQLIDAHAGPLELYARQWTTSSSDVVQESLLLLIEQPSLPASPVAWLYRVVRHRALNSARAARRRTYHERQASELRQPIEQSDPARRRLSVEGLAQLLDTLPAEEREIVIARIWGGLTWQQIGELTGLSMSTVSRRYQGALDVLRTRLEMTWPTNILR